jgi:integrase
VRGKKVSTGEPRSAHTVNRELRSVRVVLGYLSELDLLPRLTFDDLRRALKRLPVSVERLAFLRTAELSQLFRASLVHDATVVKQTGRHVADATYPAIAPFLAFILFAGTRLSEAIELTWGQVDLEEGEVHLTGATKTKRARTLDLSVSDALRALLKALKRKQEPTERVFLWLKLDTAVAAGKRLRADFGAPASFTYHGLRRTCGTALTNSSIFGAASAYRSARQLGHSVTVAEKHYTGVLKGVSNDAKTVEAVLGIEAEARAVVEFTRARFGETVGE